MIKYEPGKCMICCINPSKYYMEVGCYKITEQTHPHILPDGWAYVCEKCRKKLVEGNDVPVLSQEAIHEYFGLSYANYLVMPRGVLQSMPDEWQEKFVELLNQIPETIDEVIEPAGGYTVHAKNEQGRFIEDPLSNYERGRRRLKIKPEIPR